MDKLKIVEICSELAAGTRGASLGVGAIKTASLNKGSDFFREYKTTLVPDLNEALFAKRQEEHLHARHIPELQVMLERSCEAIYTILMEGDFPVVLGGDHSTAAGTISGIKKAHPDKRLGVIWIDAHADLHTPFTSPSGNMHGFPLAIAAAIDNQEARINAPHEGTLRAWNRLKNIGGEGAKISLHDIVYIGLRDTEEAERRLMKKYNIPNFSVAALRSRGAVSIARAALESLADCELIYVSFDVDSMDPEKVSEGTGTPVPNGLYEQEAMELNRLLVKSPKVCAWEIVEVNPTLDKCNVMGDVAFGIIESTVKELETRFIPLF